MASFVKNVGVVVGLVSVVLMQCVAARTVHVVGDGIGWTIPQGGAAAYETWAKSKTFRVGDILTFNFVTNRHDVLEVQKASYDGCTTTNPIGSTITTGPANITITSPGEHYYICTFPQHCQEGQKLKITALSSSTPGVAPSPVGCPPDAAAGPPPDAAAGPTTRPPPPPPPNSSSSTVLASLVVSFLSIILGLAFVL